MSRSVSAPSSVTKTSPCWNGLIVPGSTFRYGSNFCTWTLRPRALRSRPSEAATIPFPRPETTPPVTNTCFVARSVVTVSPRDANVACPRDGAFIAPPGRPGRTGTGRGCRHAARSGHGTLCIRRAAARRGVRRVGSSHGAKRSASTRRPPERSTRAHSARPSFWVGPVVFEGRGAHDQVEGRAGEREVLGGRLFESHSDQSLPGLREHPWGGIDADELCVGGQASCQPSQHHARPTPDIEHLIRCGHGRERCVRDPLRKEEM